MSLTLLHSGSNIKLNTKRWFSELFYHLVRTIYWGNRIAVLRFFYYCIPSLNPVCDINADTNYHLEGLF